MDHSFGIDTIHCSQLDRADPLHLKQQSQHSFSNLFASNKIHNSTHRYLTSQPSRRILSLKTKPLKAYSIRPYSCLKDADCNASCIYSINHSKIYTQLLVVDRNSICVTQLEIAKFYLELDVLRIVTLSVSIL